MPDAQRLARKIAELEEAIEFCRCRLELISAARMPRPESHDDRVFLAQFWQSEDRASFLADYKLQLKVLEKTKELLEQEEEGGGNDPALAEIISLDRYRAGMAAAADAGWLTASQS